jgi:hypothetical protein
MSPKPTLYPDVTVRALVQRINRALPKGQRLRVARGKTAGEFHLVENGTVTAVDLEALGRELQVLRLHERLST